MEQPKRTFTHTIKNFLKESWRVLRITKKPNAAEFKTVVKISAIGMLIIGLIGFTLQIINTLIFK